jgi:hypothetical protein
VLIKELRILWPFCPLSTARTNDRMIGPPPCWRWHSFVKISEAKGQASTEGFCRASARQRWRVDLATPRRLAPRRTEIPFTDSSFPTGSGSKGRPRRLPCARARARPRRCAPSIARVRTGSGRRELRVGAVRWRTRGFRRVTGDRRVAFTDLTSGKLNDRLAHGGVDRRRLWLPSA